MKVDIVWDHEDAVGNNVFMRINAKKMEEVPESNDVDLIVSKNTLHKVFLTALHFGVSENDFCYFLDEDRKTLRKVNFYIRKLKMARPVWLSSFMDKNRIHNKDLSFGKLIWPKEM